MLNINKVVNDWNRLYSDVRCYEDYTLKALVDKFDGFDVDDRSFYFTKDGITYKIIKWNNSDRAFLSSDIYIRDCSLNINTLESLQELNDISNENLFI